MEDNKIQKFMDGDDIQKYKLCEVAKSSNTANRIGNKFEKENLENRYCWISVNNENLYPNNFRLNLYIAERAPPITVERK